jgi:hypothetical protein
MWMLLAAVFLLGEWTWAAEGPVSGPDDPDFKVQGEYVGTYKSPDGDVKVAVQVIALGEGKFHAMA